MSDVNFLILTAVAAVAFAFALLQVMTQWLKADEQSTALEPGVQRKLSEDAAMRGAVMATSQPTLDHSMGSAAAPTAGGRVAPAATAAAAKSDTLDTSETAELESFIARHLIAWGGAATVLGMAIGWFVGSFGGALAGATVGTVLGVLAGTAVAALKRRQR